ncbi:hypothetical protein GCM10028822_19310 [Hymenobacter terrigena]
MQFKKEIKTSQPPPPDGTKARYRALPGHWHEVELQKRARPGERRKKGTLEKVQLTGEPAEMFAGSGPASDKRGTDDAWRVDFQLAACGANSD